ncbi:hypothetical protein CPB84DRAFT_1841860 [Gymnopilus junonius]|uniref:DUF7918 domain-containing protein n=1 Tax=Gymnopilus junonius TaxID=109634 RepID=A0A9P5TTZ6_GYMJU|nr:hypothetical protein CPB84DRAFT_1841860 [Gymnopilus junonius]
MSFINPYYIIPGLQSLRADQITCWVEGHYGPKYVGSTQRSGNSLTGWIESNAGQTFTVNWHNNQRNHHMEGTLYIDGVLCDTHIIPEASSFPEDKWSIANIGFIQVSPTSRKNFVFADVGTLVQDPGSGAGDPATNLGTIRLEIRRVKIGTAESMRSDYAYKGEALTSKSLLTTGGKYPHQVKFGEEYKQPVDRPIIVATRGSRIDQEPLYTFTFRYRPLEYLLEKKLFPPQFETPPPVIRVLTDFSADAQSGPSVNTFRQRFQTVEEYPPLPSSSSTAPPPNPSPPPPAYEDTRRPPERKKVRKVRRRREIRIQISEEEEYLSDYEE